MTTVTSKGDPLPTPHAGTSSASAAVGISTAAPTRAAVRFPMHITTMLQAGAARFEARTVDMSAVGVAFELDARLEVGTLLTWELRLPADRMGSTADITVECAGRVAWLREDTPNRIAVTIDTYQIREGSL